MTEQPPQHESPEDLPGPDFEDLVDQARSGSLEAMAELMRGSREYLLVIANHELDSDLRRKLGPSDIVQSSIMDATRCLEQFRGSSRQQFLAWLRSILHNRVARKRRDYKLSEKRNVRREQPMHVTRDSAFRPLSLAVDHPTPGTEAAKNEQLALVASCLASLPEDYQTVIHLRQWEQLPFREIARQMDRSEDACQKLWQRAIAALKQALAGTQIM